MSKKSKRKELDLDNYSRAWALQAKKSHYEQPDIDNYSRAWALQAKKSHYEQPDIDNYRQAWKLLEAHDKHEPIQGDNAKMIIHAIRDLKTSLDYHPENKQLIDFHNSRLLFLLKTHPKDLTPFTFYDNYGTYEDQLMYNANNLDRFNIDHVPRTGGRYLKSRKKYRRNKKSRRNKKNKRTRK